MKDIHSHILYDIDDGSRTLDESIEIIKQAVDNGYTDLILTPHYRFSQNYIANNEEKKNLLNILNEEVKKLGIDINIYLGNEITLDEDFMFYLNTDQISTLNNSKYLLIELPFNDYFDDLDNILDEIISMGYRVIIAHPERYRYFKNTKYFEKLIKKGVLFQGNISSLYGKYGDISKNILVEMLNKHMIHFMASDVHTSNQTSFLKSLECMDIVSKITGSRLMAEDLFINNISKVIDNLDIKPYRIINNSKLLDILESVINM